MRGGYGTVSNHPRTGFEPLEIDDMMNFFRACAIVFVSASIALHMLTPFRCFQWSVDLDPVDGLSNSEIQALQGLFEALHSICLRFTKGCVFF